MDSGMFPVRSEGQNGRQGRQPPKDQLWFQHAEIQARVARAESDFAEGRSTRTNSPEEAQAFLNSLKKSHR